MAYTSAMPEHAFRLIQKAKIGELDETMQREWDRLYEQRQRLEQEWRDFEEGMDAFAEALKDSYGSVDTHGLNAVLRVEADGVYAEYCPCPACQAHLHGMTVAETVEKMYESNLIPDDGIQDVRVKARSIDAKNKRERSMLN